jgi:photosystem II stability/assembly factor-like uncharacterized protein
VIASRRFIFALFVLLLGGMAAAARPFDPALYQDLRWRSIGPFRGGWATCAEGVPNDPDTYYFGAADGGVWKTDDAGRTWTPLLQHEGSASIGALAIAPSDPNVIYVGTGQVAPRYDIVSGDGVYKSTDGGQSWRHMGLEATKNIGRILVDPKNPDVVLVAALGHIFGPNPERGVFRSQDGGKTWTKTLFVKDTAGAVDLAADPDNPSVVYASIWEAQNYPWLSYFKPIVGPASAVYKSTDEGKTWTRLSGKGWPSGDLGRIGLAVAPGGRIYACIDAQPYLAAFEGRRGAGQSGLYRSDDGGATWLYVNHDAAIAGWYCARLTTDPRNPNVVYATGQSIRRSEDGGKTFTIVKGAPGGDDYHFLWINPKYPAHMITASDQGTVVTVNGGKTWSSWYNQPTAQFYHVETDDRFPYWVYSGQQDSGTVGASTRSDYGGLTFRDWHPVGGEERGWDVPDPLDPDIVYGSGLGGGVTRYDSRTGQVVNISPSVISGYGRRATELKYRYTWISPLAISKKTDALYFGAQVLFKSTDRGASWSVISPDLTGAVPGTKGCEGEVTVANARQCGFGVIFTIAISPIDDGEIWAGTDDGLIQLTRDGGKTWDNVTPQGLPEWDKVSTIDASALDPATAYAAVEGHRRDDFSPRVYRTHDYGRTWSLVTQGLPAGNFVSVVRADPVKKGLLYAGTDAGAFVSFDDGDHWQSLQLNLPTTWVTDLSVHGADLVAATEGRAFWILDDVTPLRQLSSEIASAKAFLYAPAPAIRVRRNENQDTPLPPETPMGQNPPAGAVIDYNLGPGVSGPVSIEILDAAGRLVRKYSSDDPPEKLPAYRYFTEEWLKPPAPLSTAPGQHRFVWDLHYTRPLALRYNYSIAAIWGENTPAVPEGALAVPGLYTVRLNAAGETLEQQLPLEMDPRVKTPPDGIARQLELAQRVAAALDRATDAAERARNAREQIADLRKKAHGSLGKELAALESKIASIAGGGGGGGRRAASGAATLSELDGHLVSLFNAVESGDAAPTAQAVSAWHDWQPALERELTRWKELETRDLAAVNRRLLKSKLPKIDPGAKAPEKEEAGESGGMMGPE